MAQKHQQSRRNGKGMKDNSMDDLTDQTTVQDDVPKDDKINSVRPPSALYDEICSLKPEKFDETLIAILNDSLAQRGVAKLIFGRFGEWRPLQKSIAVLIRYLVRNQHSIESFIQQLYKPGRLIVSSRMKSLEVSIPKEVKEKNGYLFIANHRDIVFDSLLCNASLIKRNLTSARVAVGDNLLELPDWVVRLLRIVGCFFVPRTGSTREKYFKLAELSKHIKELVEHNRSIWLAQSQGRSTTGLDLTEPGVLKMIHLCERKKDLGQVLNERRIVPVTVSYEFDPMDVSNSERLVHQKEVSYTNQSQNGLLGKRGRVSLSFGKVLEFNKAVTYEDAASQIDQKLNEQRTLWPSNYAAAEILTQKKWASTWTESEIRIAKEKLMKRFKECGEQVSDFGLSVYAANVLGKFLYDEKYFLPKGDPIT